MRLIFSPFIMLLIGVWAACSHGRSILQRCGFCIYSRRAIKTQHSLATDERGRAGGTTSVLAPHPAAAAGGALGEPVRVSCGVWLAACRVGSKAWLAKTTRYTCGSGHLCAYGLCCALEAAARALFTYRRGPSAVSFYAGSSRFACGRFVSLYFLQTPGPRGCCAALRRT